MRGAGLKKADGITAGWCTYLAKPGLLRYDDLFDRIGQGICLVVCRWRVGIDGCLVFFPGREPFELDVGCSGAVAVDTADKPVPSALCISCNGDIFSGFGLQVFAVIPVDGDIFYELEGILYISMLFYIQ